MNVFEVEGGKNQVQHQKEQNTDKKKPQKIQHHFNLVTIQNNNKAWMPFQTHLHIQTDYEILYIPSVQGITTLLLTEHWFPVLIQPECKFEPCVLPTAF